MGSNDLLSKTEEAARQLADSLTLSTDYTINTGIEDDEAKLPLVLCSASQTVEEIPKGTGNFITRLTITVKNKLEDVSLADHRADVAIVFDAFRQDDIGATLSGLVSGFYCYDPIRSASLSNEVTQEVYSDSLELELLTCASDIG